MIAIERILVPIDFSDTSRHALMLAARFASWYEARITALHAIHPVFVAALTGAAHERTVLSASTDDVRQDARNDLVALIRDTGLDPTAVDIVLDEQDAAPSIIRHASSLRGGLVVIGTHGRGGFDRLVLGSVAEKVLRKSACPTLTVPPSATTALPFKRLLCPTDFSTTSLTALEYALSIAEESDAHVTLLHVVNWPPDETGRLSEIAPGAYEMRRSLEDHAQRRLDALVPHGLTACSVSQSVEYGRPYERIIESAESADLIVMGVHGRNALDLALFGSTTNQVVRHAKCPVLTVRH